MAIAKVCGIETEYGISASADVAPNPVSASSMLINAYAQEIARSRTGWDFEDETPGKDARGFAREGAMAPEVETHLVNTVLTNGARYYVDHAHPEYSTPECADPLEVVTWDKAGERILARSMAAVDRVTGADGGIVVYKNNSDGKGNSYGCHENYLMERQVPFARIVQHLVPHLVSRQIYTGAGKVGCEARPPEDTPVTFQLSQRSDFFEEVVGLETTLKRPIVNTRDEPHANAERYRRLHVIVGDANVAEVATFLKVGATAVVLAMIEDDYFGSADLALDAPVRALRDVSYDVTLRRALPLADGRRMTALEIQWELFDRARKYGEDRGLACIGEPEVVATLLRRWEDVLVQLESDPMELDRQLDWVAKYRLVSAYRERHGLDWDAHRLAAVDLQYHDVRPDRSLAARLALERLTGEAAVEAATTVAPRTTRAFFRGGCLARWPEAILSANWDSLVFDLGKDPLRRVPMMEPLKGTAGHVEELLMGCSSPEELLDRLGT